MQQIQKTLTLIGFHKNEYVIESLRVKLSMLDFIFIKDGLVDSIDLKKGNKEEEELYAGFKRAGFSHNVTFYLISVIII